MDTIQAQRAPRMLIISTLLLLLAACAAAPAPVESGSPQAAPTGDPGPRTARPFDAAEGKFTFAVFSDLTGGERDGVFEVAVAQLNLLRPEFIMSIGDLIEGADTRAEIDRQWDSFDERAKRARAPVFYVGGNHDLLGTAMQNAWAERIGPSYYHFVYKDVLFLVLDTEDHTPERLRELARLRREAYAVAETQGWDAFAETPYARAPENAAGAVSEAQAAYMIRAIEENRSVRHTFVFTHKAPWLREDLEAFRTIEAALADRPYTVFHGHEHGYRHQRRQDRDYIQLATTGGVFLPDNGRAMDHVVLVTVDDGGVDIANLILSGILDRTGKLPAGGEALCFEPAACTEE